MNMWAHMGPIISWATNGTFVDHIWDHMAKKYLGRPVSVSGFIPGFSVFVKSPVSVPVSAPEMHRKHRKSLPNGRQQGGAFGAAPRGRRFAPPPWGSCCLPFGKDFLCFWCISGALLDLHGPPSPLWKLRPWSALVGPPPLFRHLQYICLTTADPAENARPEARRVDPL